VNSSKIFPELNFYPTVGILMPPLKATRLQHIQDVLSGRKKALKQKNVPARYIPRWPELCVKIIYPQVIDTLQELRHYLPEPQGK
jgi:hypothetical protein